MMIRNILAAFGFFVVAMAQANAMPSKRVALVIGNSSYATAPLANPINDSRDFAQKIKSFGYEVVYRENLKVCQSGRVFREFKSVLAPGANVIVFYAGHGLQIRGENYFPTVDADIQGEEDVPNQSLALKQIMEIVDDAKTGSNIVFLDACRNNPFDRKSRSLSRGLARVDSPSGTLISYSTRPGSVADDGVGRNGLYTSQLLREMDGQKPIEQILKSVVSNVKSLSKGRQEPWFEGSLEGEFCFNKCLDYEAEKARMVEEVNFWESVLTKNTIADYESYIQKYPKGTFVTSAQKSIERIKNTPPPVAVPSTPAAPQQPAIDVNALNERFSREREALIREAEAIKMRELQKIEAQKRQELEKIEAERRERERQLAVAQRKLEEEERARAELEKQITKMKNAPAPAAASPEAKPVTPGRIFMSPTF